MGWFRREPLPAQESADHGGAVHYGGPYRFRPAGAAWLPDNTIVFATSNPLTGLQRVSADGGPPTTLTTPDTARGEFDHLWPSPLPGGRALLHTVIARSGDWRRPKWRSTTWTRTIHVAAVRRQQRRLRVQRPPGLRCRRHAVGRSVRFSPSNDVWHGGAGGERMVTTGNGAGTFDVSSNGTLVYGRGLALIRSLTR